MVGEQGSGLRPGRTELRQGWARTVREGARVSKERGVRWRCKINHSWAKNRATSRRVGSRRDVTESKIVHVASCRFTSRRDRGHDQMTSRRAGQRRDVAE